MPIPMTDSSEQKNDRFSLWLVEKRIGNLSIGFQINQLCTADITKINMGSLTHFQMTFFKSYECNC